MKAFYLSIALVAVAACGGSPKQEPAAAGHQGMAMDSGGMSMAGKSMTPMMQAHMDSMGRMSSEQMSASMGKHERMMSEMMDRMGGEMRQMQMAETGEWTALTDSVRQDLAQLPSLSGEKLQTRMRAHVKRVQRLLAAHEQMMKGM